MVLGPPYLWCDGACDRCPVSAECRRRRRIEGHEWRARMRGDDPRSVDVMMGQVADDLRSALAMLERAAEEAGIDPNEPPDLPPPDLAARRLTSEAKRFSEVLSEVAEAAARASHVSRARHLTGRGHLIMMKSARLRAQTELHDWSDIEAWEPDGAPTVMLVEYLLAEVEAAVTSAGLESERYRGARAAYLRAFEPFARQASPKARAELARLVAAGRAPSPFITTNSP